MNLESDSQDAFAEILKSEVAIVRCNGCGSDQPVNVAYLPYLRDGISSCRMCRNPGKAF